MQFRKVLRLSRKYKEPSIDNLLEANNCTVIFMEANGQQINRQIFL